jgi:RimJ/RimL family protein N-acetyltransferase
MIRMAPDLNHCIRQTWCTTFGLAESEVMQPGTTLIPRDTMRIDSWLSLWPVGERVVIESPPAYSGPLHTLISRFPPDHRLALDDVRRAWDEIELETNSMGLYTLDPAAFAPLVPPAPITIRPLTGSDRAAFDAFQAQFSAQERREADIGLDNDVIYGALDGDRIVAAASTYEWRGFVDIGVMTDPAYRRRGLAAAVVSVLSQHYIDSGDPRVVIYRHDAVNTPSQGVAEKLGMILYAVIDDFRIPDRD